MRRWVTLAVVAVVAAVPGRAMAVDCTPIGAPGQFDVLTGGAFGLTSSGGTIEGRVAVVGDAQLQGGVTIGKNPPLTPDKTRTDLMVAGDMTVASSGGSVPLGRATYGGALTANGTLTTYGGLTRAAPDPDIAAEFATLKARSAETAKMAPYVTAPDPVYDVLTLTNKGSALNVFRVTTAQMQNARQIRIDVDAGSTTVINVSGSSFTSQLYGIQLLGATPETVLWNFATATDVQQHSGLDWRGTVLAPNAAVSISNGQFYGQIFASKGTVGSELVHHVPYGGCLSPAPPPPPTPTLSLESLCTDPLTKLHSLRLTNKGASERAVQWHATDDGQEEGHFDAPARSDTFFDVHDGDHVHHIVVTSGSTTLEATTGTNECGGTITVRKLVTGAGQPPAGPWVIAIKGDNSVSKTVALVAGASASVDVPGHFQAGSVAIGEIVGGYRYTISEPDPRGAVASIDPTLVTITDGGGPKLVNVGNDYAEPEPPEPPVPPITPPPQPPLPPGPSDPLSGPDLVLAASLLGGADLQVTERLSPRVLAVGDQVSVTVRVRNNGPLPAVGAVAREIPQVDPQRPNQIARVGNLTATVRAASGCTSSRPVTCGPATLAVGAEVVIRSKVRVLVSGFLQSVIVATSKTPDPNTTNNLAVTGLLVTRPASIAAGVRAPALARVGEPVAYRVIARGTGSDGATAIRVCHRPPARLLMTSAPGTFRSRGRACRDIRRLARGQQAGFTVHAIPAASAGGRTLALRATATAPDARPAAGSDRIAVAAQTFVGTG